MVASSLSLRRLESVLEPNAADWLPVRTLSSLNHLMKSSSRSAIAPRHTGLRIDCSGYARFDGLTHLVVSMRGDMRKLRCHRSLLGKLQCRIDSSCLSSFPATSFSGAVYLQIFVIGINTSHKIKMSPCSYVIRLEPNLSTRWDLSMSIFTSYRPRCSTTSMRRLLLWCIWLYRPRSFQRLHRSKRNMHRVALHSSDLFDVALAEAETSAEPIA